MAVTKLNLVIDAGTDYFLSAEYDDYLTGLPRDISGYNAVLEVRPDWNDSTVLLTLSNSNGGILLGETGGGIVAHFTPADTDPYQQPIAWTKGVYDMLLTDQNQVVTKLLTGYIIISGTVSLNS